MRRGGGRSAGIGGVADDGKRLEAVDVVVACVWRSKGRRFTGSAFKRWTLSVSLLLGEKVLFIKEGGSLREGGSNIEPDRRHADDGKRF